MKYDYFLIDGEKFYSPQSIFEKLKDIGNDKHILYERELNHIKLCVSDRCKLYIDHRRTIMIYVESKFPENRTFEKIRCRKNGVRNLIFLGRQETCTMIFMSNGQIFDVMTDYECDEYMENKKFPLTIIEECVWKIRKLKYNFHEQYE